MTAAPVLRSIRTGAALFSFLLAALFAFQILDIPPSNAHKNPKTCCARAICLCKHAKGAACDFKKKPALPAAETPSPAMPGHCAMSKRNSAPETEKASVPEGAASFAKAPCSSQAPASVLPRTFKDFISISTFIPAESGMLEDYSAPDLSIRLSHPVPGIEYPPRPLFFSF